MAISPHFHVHLHASNSCNAWRCCIDDSAKEEEHKRKIKNRRMVPISDTAIAPENHSNGCWSAMKRALCCCCVTSDAEHNEKAVTIYRNYLVQEYGPAVENMMENIKASLEQLDGEEVSSRTLLGLVVQELMGRGFEIKAPECLNQVPHSVRQDLTSKSAKGTLEAKERAILLSTLTGQSPQGEAPSGSVPDPMEIDID